MAQLSQLTLAMNTIQAKMKALASTSTNITRKRLNSTAGAVEENALMGVKPDFSRELTIKRRHNTIKYLGVMGDNKKIEIYTPKLSLINNIGTPHNSPSKQTLAITDSGANMHLSKQSTTKMAPVII